MARDDYHVIAYKILVYLYARYKGKIIYDEAAYSLAIDKNKIDESYLTRIYKTMTEDGLIEGLTFVRAWGDIYMAVGDEDDIRITADGIHYLEDNDKMKTIGELLLKKLDPIASLAKLIFGG